MESTVRLHYFVMLQRGAQRNIFSKIAGRDCQVTAGTPTPDANGFVEEAYCSPQGQISLNYYGSVYRECNYWDVY